ncbi:leucine-rich repeat protein [Leadbettera azotonutricia]|uniref:Cell surface protein n=1 Tax=Leadbettera azotonutricia (strain ATCC BAA-888 / DSM 13862 / ZAS-9) TaxID=545695 RepID=F5YFR9_LEAAZ|nr:leucine-rich repeat protein [Leadbettera azotonutricia]AEF81251.1 cell surface protein [Leadbettera azotonutricia ZAS-9]
MLEKGTNIFVGFHPDDERLVLPTLEQVRAAGWYNIDIPGLQAEQTAILESIRQSGMVLIFLTKAYVRDQRLMLEEFAYAATVARKPFIPVWLDSLADIQQDYQNRECDPQLLSALEMLTARYSCTSIGKLIAELERFTPDDTPYTPSTPQICDKPCEAYEGDEPYIFISYAHDDAIQVYPKIKELYESGWDLWYDEGIKVTERYLPVIADHVRHCSVFVLMLTNRCLDRPFVMNYELEYARQRGIPIVPVLLEELTPQPWSMENAAQLVKTAIAPDALQMSISSVDLKNCGKRTAVPPAIKQNVVYDVNLPLDMPGFNILVQGDKITITRYVGNDRDVIIPSTATSAEGNITFQVTAIGDYAFTGGSRGISKIMLNIGMISSGMLNDKTKTDKDLLKKCRLLTSITIPDSITSIGQGAFSGCESLESLTIPDNITSIGGFIFFGCRSLKSITIPKNIICIGDYAFSGCKSLKNITIPKGIVSIGDHAFSGCKSLISVVLPDSVTSIGGSAFFNCTSLTEIDIPDSVESIADETFSFCKSLTNLIIPDSVTNIGYKAFCGCNSLKNIILPKDIEIGKETFSYCHQLDAVFNTDKTTIFCGPQNWNSAKPYAIPDGVIIINPGAFSSLSFFSRIIIQILTKCQVIKCRLPDSIIIPDSVTEIGAEAFAGSVNLKSIIIPNSVTNIGDKAFSGCKSLKRVFIPDSVIKIGDDAFSKCKSMKSITISGNVINIGQSAFKECKSLSNVIIPESVKEICAETFSKCSSLKNITIPNSVESVLDNAFAYCISLSSVILPEGITGIDNRVFQGCKSLENIVIPKSITSIGESAFEGCKALKSVTIPENVVSIGEKSFWGCTSLKNAAIPDSVTSIGYKAFRGTPVELSVLERIPVDEVQEQEMEIQEVKKIKPGQLIPKSNETPRAYICCAKWDIEHISTLLAELYWEGFNFYYSKTTVEQEIDDSQCVLAFFSDKTAGSGQAMKKIKYAVQHDPSHIIQVFLGGCTDWPDEIRGKLHDRQAIIQSLCSQQEFSGRIRDSLRKFGCNIGHPRGFDVQKNDNTVEIVKFYPTDFPRLIIPETFFNPPLTLTSIGATAFRNCESLIDVTIPNGVTNIGGINIFSGAFSGCKSLENVNIPDSVLSIGANAFSGCETLININIPESVTSIGDYAFSCCSSLKNIVIPGGISKIADSVFTFCKSLTSIDIPDGIKSIGDSAFSGCKSLRNVNIPNSVTTIGENAFSSCGSLVHVTIPDEVEEIGSGAFNYCMSLKTVIIPEKVKKFGKIAPGFLIFLRNTIAFFDATTTTMVDYDEVFEHCRFLTIYTPLGSKAWKYAKKNNIKHGDYKEAIEYFDKVIKNHRQVSPKDSKKLLELLDVLRKLQVKVYGEENEAVATTYNTIGLAYFRIGDINMALEYAQKSLMMRKKVLGDEHADTAMSYSNMAEVYKSIKDYNMALEVQLKALEIRLSIFPDNYNLLGATYSGAGEIYCCLQKINEAIEYYKKAQQKYRANKPRDFNVLLKVTNKMVELQKQISTEENADIAENYDGIGSLYFGLKEYNKSLQYAIRAFEIRKTIFGEEHIEVIKSLINVGIVYNKIGNYTESLKALKSVLEVGQRTNSLEQLNVALIHDLISKMLTPLVE